ncbi:hypothetical protein [Ruegeria atlantica]|uniref:hypothetical protein n=1 Tax=Ruegeria atlantica TaxID=81569 RepID=UPI00147EF636|nr:hypothetical protein [Ruegeria atlantica]
MAVNFELLNTLEPVCGEQLAQMHTGSLLRRLNDLRSLQETFPQSDWTVEDKQAVEAAGLIAFKDQENWKHAWTDVKNELAQREHLKRGSKEKRRAVQKRKQNR